MALQIEEIESVLQNKESVITISAVGKNGNPYTEVSRKLVLREDKRIAYYEFLESSQLQKNLVYSLWFGKEIAVNVIDRKGKNYFIKAKPYRAVIAGHEFEEEYIKTQEEFGEKTDLSTVWLLDVLEVQDDTYEEAKAREEKEHPYLMHMDHIYKKE